ncbi:MAG: hypothetical protein ACQSGP_28750 [Frankia sp.]
MTSPAPAVHPTSEALIGYYLYPVTPVRALDECIDAIQRLVPLDPKLAEAVRLLDGRLGELGSDDDRETLAALLWLQVRPALRSASNLAILRRALGEGDAILQFVERSLTTTLDLTLLQAVLKEAEAASGDLNVPGGGELSGARREIRTSRAGQSDVVAAIAAAVGIAVVVAAVVVGVAYGLSYALGSGDAGDAGPVDGG